MNEYKKNANELRWKAQDLKDFYDSFVEVGFTEEQSWELFMECVKGSFKR